MGGRWQREFGSPVEGVLGTDFCSAWVEGIESGGERKRRSRNRRLRSEGGGKRREWGKESIWICLKE